MTIDFKEELWGKVDDHELIKHPEELLDHLSVLSHWCIEVEELAAEQKRVIFDRMAHLLLSWEWAQEGAAMDLDSMARLECKHGHVWFARAWFQNGTRLDPPDTGLINEDLWFCPRCNEEGDWK